MQKGRRLLKRNKMSNWLSLLTWIINCVQLAIRFLTARSRFLTFTRNWLLVISQWSLFEG
jgi:hypothetical protein